MVARGGYSEDNRLMRAAKPALLISIATVLVAVLGLVRGGSSHEQRQRIADGTSIASPDVGSSSGSASVTVSDGSVSSVASGPIASAMPVPTSLSRAVHRTGLVVDVTKYGAKGDGRSDDSVAVQAANDDVARRGGGVIVFPSGTYLASGVRQDSFVEFLGRAGAVIEHPNGRSTEQIFRSRPLRSAGSIASGSNVLHVASTARFVPGAVIAIRGAGGPSAIQRSTLVTRVWESSGAFAVRDAAGFSTGKTYSPNYLMIDREIVSYVSLSGTQLLGVQRGLFGTRAAQHAAGVRVAQLSVLYATVRSMTANTVTIDRPALSTVSNAKVFIGSVGMKITDLTLDGNRASSGSSTATPFPVLYELASDAAVTGCTIRNGDDGAIEFAQGTTRSLIANNTLLDNGDPNGRGAAVWLFQGANHNIVRDNTIGGDSYSGVYVDDRTVSSTEFDASSAANQIVDNSISIARSSANTAVGIFGSSSNIVRGNALDGTTYGVRIYTGGQSPVRAPTSGNLVADNTLDGHNVGIWVDGRNNHIVSNALTDVRTPLIDEGSDNTVR